MKIQKKEKTWIEESIEKMGEKPEDFACEDIECEEKKREQAEKEMNKRLEPSKKNGEKVKGEDHVETKPLKEETENITSYDVKDRKELASLLEELHLTTKDVSIKRSVKEGCRYQVTLKSVLNETKEEIKEEPTKDKEVFEYIKSHLTDYDKTFGQDENFLVFSIKETPELEAWAKEVVEANTGKKFTKKFLDDLPEIEEPEEVKEEGVKGEKQINEDIDKEALEFYVKNWQEGDNVTVTADLLNVLEQALEMSKKYDKDEASLEEGVEEDALVGKSVKFIDKEYKIKDVEGEGQDAVFNLENDKEEKSISPTIAYEKGNLKSDDVEVTNYLNKFSKPEEETKEEKPEEKKPEISEYERGAQAARADFYDKEQDRSKYNAYRKELNPIDFERGYMDAYKKLDSSKVERTRKRLKDPLGTTYNGDVDELVKWLKDAIVSIDVITSSDRLDSVEEFVKELNKRDGTNFKVKVGSNREGDQYIVRLTSNKEILDRMPEEVKSWVAPKNSGKFGAKASKIDAPVYNEKEHELTSNEIIKDLLVNRGFHLGEYKESLGEEVIDEMAKLPYGVLAWKLNEIISSMNNEEAYFGSWLYLWPDGESLEDAKYDFNDEDSYNELKDLFERIYKEYHDDGLYTSDQSIVDYAHKIDAKLGLEPIKNYMSISDKGVGDDPYDESLNEGRYSDLEHKLSEKEKELKELKVKLENTHDEESREEIEVSIDICQNDIANIEGELAEIRYIDNGSGFNLDYEESLNEDKEQVNEVLDDEEIDDDFFVDDNMVDIEDVDDDMKVGDMSFDDKMDFLATDEEEAIEGYDEVIDTIEDEHVKDQLEHIRDEEVAHKEFLDAVKEDPNASYEDFEHEEEVVDNSPKEEFVDVEDVDDDMTIGESIEESKAVTITLPKNLSDLKEEVQEQVFEEVKKELNIENQEIVNEEEAFAKGDEDDDFGPIHESCSDKELVDLLVAHGSCDSEEEAEKRVAKMTDETKSQMCKTLKAKSQWNLIND